MAVHRLTTASPPVTPRRSPRLPTRKRARVSDAEQQLAPSSSKLPLLPDPSPRSIRAQKRQKILDGSSRASPPPPSTPIIENGSTRAGKRKSLIPHDHPESDSHLRVPKKKRKKENIVNDALTANTTTSLLKISVTRDTRQGAGNNNTGQSQSLRNTRSKSTLSVPDSKVNPKSKLHFTSAAPVPSDPSCDPSSSSSSSRMMTRTMKKLSQDGAQTRSAPADSTHTYTIRSHLFALGSKTILSSTSVSSSAIPSPSEISVIQSDIPISDVTPSSTATTTTTTSSDAITNDAHDTATSNLSSSETTPSPLSKSSIEIPTSLSMPLPISIPALPMSFMNVPLPLNLAFSNMPLAMPLSMPLNISISNDISTTLAPSESELGFGFQPQEEFSSTGREEGRGKGNGEDGNKVREGEHIFPQQLSSPPLLTPARPITNESTTNRLSSDIYLDCPPSPPPQSCTPCLNPISPTPTRIPPRLVISTCLPDQPRPTSTSPTSPTSSSPSFTNPTSPTHSSPLKAVCFPSLPVPQQQPFPSTSQWQQPSPPTLVPLQLPSLSALPPSSAHEHGMKEWAMDMQTERALEQEMGVELSLSFRNSSTVQEDESPLVQQELEEEQDRSPLLGPAPQPSSPQPPAQYPQLPPSFPCPPSPSCCSSSSSSAPSNSSRQYDKKVEYQHHQLPEWTPKLDKERNLWKLACKIRVWEITKRYTPDTIRTVVAQEAHDYYSAHGFPLGYGSVPVRSRRRRWRKIVGGVGSSTTATAGSDSDCVSPITPSPSPTSPREDEFMNEETYSFELMDDDDDIDGPVSGGVGLGVGGLRSMEDEWKYEGFEDDEFGFDDYDDEDDDDEDYDDLYEDDDDEVDKVVEGNGDRTKISGNRKKKGDVSYIAGEDQDQDPDAEGEMEIDIEPFQDPSFNAELSSPTPASSFKSKSRSKLSSEVGVEPQSFVSSFYIPPVPPHVQHMLQMQQQQQQQHQHQQRQEEEVPTLAPSPLDNSTNPLSSSEGSPISTFDNVDHGTTTNPNDEINHTPMQIHLPPASHHAHHYHSQLVQVSSNILPLPPPRLDSIRVFILRQSEMGGLKTTGRGTPADRKRGAIWCGVQVGREDGTSRNKRGLDDGKGSESDEENGGGDEGGRRGRPRLRLMLSDHDIEAGPRHGGREGEDGDGAKTGLKLSLLNDIDDDADERMPVGFKCDISESSSNSTNINDNHRTSPAHSKPSSSSSTSTFVATDQTWDAFLASLDEKNHQPPQQQQGEEGMFDSSVTAADDSDTTHGQLLLDLDGHRFSNQHRRSPSPHNVAVTTTAIRRLGPSLSSPPPTSLEGSSGMFMFDHEGGDDGDGGSSSTWFGDDEGGLGVRSGGGVGAGVGSSGTCPSDALVMEGFNFPVGPDGSSTLSYALG